MSRRGFASAALALCVLAPARAGRAEAVTTAVTTADGLYTQPWFLQSFLTLADDLAEATAAGKRFVIVWEQRGCSYCRDLHLVAFADPVLAAYVRDNFAVLSLNLHGSRVVTDFDGEALEERALARKYGIVFTPTFQFFPEDPAAMAGKRVADAEVNRTRGLLAPPDLLYLFRHVRERGYERQSG
ncbi:SoxW family protein [Azospirillum sp. ST 5-10]|uniref:SoxW family protein n=1 Tax=unclassified Azospirillum TaxID=2630922 RepID=UPI003F49F037